MTRDDLCIHHQETREEPPLSHRTRTPLMLSIFSSEEEVASALNMRWEDPALEGAVRAFLDGHIPPPLMLRPRAVLFRQLATPDNEFKEFMNKSQRLGLLPLAFEYLNDLFTTRNHGKLCLAKMSFYKDNGQARSASISTLRTIDLSGPNENKRLSEILTLSGEPLAAFHRRLLGRFYRVETYDGSNWFKLMGGRPHLYYTKYFAMTLRHVLLENIEVGREDRFVNEVLLPAFEAVRRRFGMKPLLLPIAPHAELNSKYWWCYPEEVKQLVKDSLRIRGFSSS